MAHTKQIMKYLVEFVLVINMHETLEENIVLKWEIKYANYYYPSLIPHILPGKK